MGLGGRIEVLARALGGSLDPATRDRLEGFASLVRAWNARLDLTAARADDALIEVLFADAMVLRDRALVPEAASVVDIGSGAGAPAIPLAIVRRDLRIALLEPRRKRIAFLRTAIGSLDLAARVCAIEGRIDPARPSLEGDFDLAMARATFAPAEWLRIGRALAPSVLVFATEELPERPAQRRDYALPWSGAPRVIGRYADRENEEGEGFRPGEP